MTQDEALELLSEAGALLEGHFRLSSGLHSPRYLQCAVALQHPGIAEQLGGALAAKWQAAGHPAADLVVSPALGGLIIGHEVGRGLRVRACFTERVEGLMTLRRGFHIEAGEKVLLVEDVITTGRSTQETAVAVSQAGGIPIGVACVANRSGKLHLGDLPLLSLVELEIPTFEPSACPLCAAGEEMIKPGSRPAPS
jgi:orotate phosphoribosyltransferase